MLGGLILAFQAYTVINWVSGPYFVRVPQGPSELPTWMKIELILWQVLSIPAALALIYFFVVRPWRREGRVGVDGLIAIAAISVSWHDPISAYAQPWFTYNSYMVNFGSWVAGVPGMSAFHAPGAMVVEPIFFINSAYVYIFVGVAAFGAWVMRSVRARYPSIGNASLIGVCLLVVVVFDIILEGLIFLPLAVFEYPGGHWPLFFADEYHKYPLQEMITIVPVFTTAACLKFFLDDRGNSIADRGIDQIRGGSGKKLAMRLLATVAFLNMAMLLFYTVPNTVMSINQPAWPRDLQERSYLTNGVCGAGTDRSCPGPGTPIVRQGAPYLGPDGRMVIPPGTEPQPIIPFKHIGQAGS
jgi:hypothetical protein